jgi:CheY-like chemotaxis protein
MGEDLCRIFILDLDQETLIALEKALEDAGFDTTTTWNSNEARWLLKDGDFDFVLVGDHPPELDAAKILRELQGERRYGECVVLSHNLFDNHASQVDRFGGLGVVAVIPKHDHPGVIKLLGKRSQILRVMPKTPAAANRVARPFEVVASSSNPEHCCSRNRA